MKPCPIIDHLRYIVHKCFIMQYKFCYDGVSLYKAHGELGVAMSCIIDLMYFGQTQICFHLYSIYVCS